MPRRTQAPIDFVKISGTLAALGAEPRLRIVYHLLRAHPGGMIAGEIQRVLGMQPSAVSHHLEKLKHEKLVRMKREGTFLRYTANPEILEELLTFLYTQCCADTATAAPQRGCKFCAVEPPKPPRRRA